MPNLSMVVSMGAGLDHIDKDASISTNITRSRIVTQVLQQNMAQYVLQHILNDHRHHNPYLDQQAQQQWQVLENDEQMPVVGFLGLGEIGSYVADRCQDLGFQTMAWTTRQLHPKHRCYHGQTGLKYVCQNSKYLVILLPLNQQTDGIINQTTLSWCHADCTLINVGRGRHVNETDLILALDQGSIKQAILDVFIEEPLPVDHPYWNHPKITITPHSSSRSDVHQTAEQIVAMYQSLDQ
jgi:glyoxylate/hydroxypyruvate reductase A